MHTRLGLAVAFTFALTACASSRAARQERADASGPREQTPHVERGGAMEQGAAVERAARGEAQPARRSPDRVGDGQGPPPLVTNAGEVKGVVAEVDRDAGTVSVKAGDTVRTVQLAAEASVLIDDFSASFDDLQEGQAVRAALQDTGGRVEAVRIQILNQAVPVEEDAPEPQDGATR